MDEPLAKIVAGEWNLDEIAKKRLASKIEEREERITRERLNDLFRTKNYKVIVTAVDDMAKDHPKLADDFLWMKCVSLCNGGEIEQGLALSSKLIESKWDEAPSLNQWSWEVIDPRLTNEPNPRVTQLALKAAKRAVELTKEGDWSKLDTLAVAQFRTGDINGAIANEEKAIKLLEAMDDKAERDFVKQFRERLDSYRKTAAAKKSRD
jgi:hypothetical protein